MLIRKSTPFKARKVGSFNTTVRLDLIDRSTQADRPLNSSRLTARLTTIERTSKISLIYASLIDLSLSLLILSFSFLD